MICNNVVKEVSNALLPKVKVSRIRSIFNLSQFSNKRASKHQLKHLFIKRFKKPIQKECVPISISDFIVLLKNKRDSMTNGKLPLISSEKKLTTWDIEKSAAIKVPRIPSCSSFDSLLANKKYNKSKSFNSIQTLPQNHSIRQEEVDESFEYSIKGIKKMKKIIIRMPKITERVCISRQQMNLLVRETCLSGEINI